MIIAPGRALRPNAFAREIPSQQAIEDCPFCEGREECTPPTKFAWSDPAGTTSNHAWQTRVFENKFPAVTNFSDHREEPSDHEFFPSHPAAGVHEVIVESPRHVVSITELTQIEMLGCWLTYRHRLQELSQNQSIEYVKIFKNVGAAAGASIEHTHSQLIALPFVPPEQQLRQQRSRNYWEETGRCLVCQLIQTALKEHVRIVARNNSFLALCPYSSRVPYETWIVPLEHSSHFEHVSDSQVVDLCELLFAIVSAMEKRLGLLAYNYVLQTGPAQQPTNFYYHWHLEILPRTTKLAGFEFGTGCYINPVAPERAAAELSVAINSTKRE